MRLGLAQINPTVGDIAGNLALIKQNIQQALQQQVQLLAFPELAISGYPPEDLLLREDFIKENQRALGELIQYTQGKDIMVVVGFVDTSDDIHNAAAVLYQGRLIDVYHKVFLPNYGVFDDKRYFMPGNRFPVYEFKGVRVGVNVCEDIWHPDGPALYQALLANAQIIVNINASPFHLGKHQQRERMLSTRASDNGVFLAYVNCVGGQDELVFDGGSVVMGPDGSLLARAPLFEESLLVVDVEPAQVLRTRAHDTRRREQRMRCSPPGTTQLVEIDQDKGQLLDVREPMGQVAQLPSSPEEEIWQALVMGTRDYVRKNGFKKVLVGLSGGIDSGVVAVIAADAIGPENLTCLFMPSRFTSQASRDDAFALASNINARIIEIGIDDLFSSYLASLKEVFAGTEPSVAEENIQARIRGNLLMALSNKFGHLVLTTGNKSELSTGYATLYGDMSGGFAVLKDVFKTTVYRLARYRNRVSPVIPESMLTKAPSAELKENQTDQDTLPPYNVLDPVLKMYIEQDFSPQDIVDRGFDPQLVRRVISMVDASEYKRRQAPPGIKITIRAFGRDRRMPITNLFRRNGNGG